MNIEWIITLAAGLLLAVAIGAAVVIRTRRERARADAIERDTRPTPDGPGYEDGDPMPHPKSAPLPEFDGPRHGRRAPRVGDSFGGGSSTARRMTGDQRARAGHVPDPADPLAPHNPASPLYPAGYYYGGAVDTPRESSTPDPSPSWGGYSGGGYSSGHDSGSSHSSGGSSGGSSYDSGSSGGGYSGGGDSGGGGSY